MKNSKSIPTVLLMALLIGSMFLSLYSTHKSSKAMEHSEQLSARVDTMSTDTVLYKNHSLLMARMSERQDGLSTRVATDVGSINEKVTALTNFANIQMQWDYVVDSTLSKKAFPIVKDSIP